MAWNYDNDFMMGYNFDDTLPTTTFDDYELGAVPNAGSQLSLSTTFMPSSSYGDFSLSSPAYINRREDPFVPAEYRSSSSNRPRFSAEIDVPSPYLAYAKLPYYRQESPFNTTESSLSSASNYSPKMPTRQSTFYGDAGSFSTSFEPTVSFGNLALSGFHNPGVSSLPCIKPFEVYQKPPVVDVDPAGFEVSAAFHGAGGEAKGSILQPTYGNEYDAEYDSDDGDFTMIELTPNAHREATPSDLSDSDYVERKGYSPKRTRLQRTIGAENGHATTRSKVGKTYAPRRSSIGGRGTRAAATVGRQRQVNGSSEANGDGPQPFSCPLEPYGCRATFRSKNEWKRHITTQHLAGTYWDCDLCRDHATKPNLFNRRDLFIMHLRRMHHPLKEVLDAEGIETPKRKPKKSNGDGRTPKKARTLTAEEKAKDDTFEGELQNHRVRCQAEKHTLPAKMMCAFCGQEFAGDKNCDDWMEHLGDHLIKEGVDENGYRPQWKNDGSLRDWLLEKGIIVPKKGEMGAWVLSKKDTQASCAEDE